MSAHGIGSVDGTHGWAHNLWRMLADGGVWGVPRCGLTYQKEGQENRLVLVERLPWTEGMPDTAEDLRADQDWDHERIVTMFAAIGIEVVDDA